MAFRPAQVLANTRNLVLAIAVSALCGVLLAGIALPVVAGIGVGARESADAFEELPVEFEAAQMDQRSRVVDADGRTLALIYDNDNYNDGNRVYVGLKRIAPVMQDAILAIEDDRFYDRGPIDFQGTLRALINNAQEGETTGGGSTLTQQYVKQTRLTQAKTDKERAAVQASDGVEGYRRKLEELRIAISVEQEYTKNEILERYLNIVYFGNGAYGVEAAARTYFGKTAGTLKLREAALLAGMVQNPPQYDPVEKATKEAATNRRDTVINAMVRTERVTEAQGAKAKGSLGLNFNYPDNGCIDSWAGYYCDYIVNELLTMKELGKNRAARQQLLETGGLTIQTTLDRDSQRAADDAVHDRAYSTDNAIVSLASVEPGTGYVEAMSNSRKYGIKGEGVSNINYAVDYKLGGGNGIQPGSTFKAFVLAAAIDQGIGLSTSIKSPDALGYGDGDRWNTCDGSVGTEPWNPGNYEGASPGTYNLRSGTEQSVNTFYIQLSQRTGLCGPATIAQNAGVDASNAGKQYDSNKNGKIDKNDERYSSDLQQIPSFTLGVNLVSPLSMAEAYATFANRGMHCSATGVLSVTDSTGKKIVDHTKPKCERVIDKNVADTVNEVLQGVMTKGTGSGVQLDGRPAAGKTGTANEFISVWFAGFTPQLATAVAVADVDGRQTSLRGRTLGGEYIDSPSGSGTAGPVWQEYMNAAHEGRDVQGFAAPDEDTVRGKTATIPDVRGKSTDDAIAILQDKGFIGSVSEEKNSDRPKGEVIGTEPGAGSEVTAGSYVGLIVSNGKEGGDEGGNDGGNDGGGEWGDELGGDENGELPEPSPGLDRIDDD